MKVFPTNKLGAIVTNEPLIEINAYQCQRICLEGLESVGNFSDFKKMKTLLISVPDFMEDYETVDVAVVSTVLPCIVSGKCNPRLKI